MGSIAKPDKSNLCSDNSTNRAPYIQGARLQKYTQFSLQLRHGGCLAVDGWSS